ncbi:hypothetical protein NLX71_25380 [Paenibacillus sp. MZ04-78.2]|nr:hypothetical protein [Paenibacillus sp. MZ04-78.2]MCP3776581.1 hypothetical protein [Paenibacillus sp. MZ04-78.2]
MQKLLSLVLAFALTTLVACGTPIAPEKKTAMSVTDWKYRFVYWNGNIYAVSKDEKVVEIDKEIGEVETYSDQEADFSKSTVFSNAFPKGAKLYSISNVDQNAAIAVESEVGKYTILKKTESK